ncbi:MAG: hypothetical protein CM1200mP10_14120 [Candidatus Neomarinimicrobiota bacterium]|nr:MAG: hypothetical protein CM1200mP10_14120 [Candidatus Neomarinimicrobiota bacterium]
MQNESKNHLADFSIKSVYPNPNNGYCKIDLDIAKAGIYEISVIDLQGKLVRTIKNESLHRGSYTFTLQENIPSGIYFVNVQSDEFSIVKKMIRLK